MKFSFNSKKFSATDEQKAYAEKKLAKLDRFFRDEADAQVVYYETRGRFGVEVTLSAGGLFFRVDELTGDMFASIDSAVGAIERQLAVHRTKISKNKRRRDSLRTMEVDALPTLPTQAEDDKEFGIAKVKRFPLKPMSAEEAVLQMKLLNHSFFAFRNEDDGGAFSVVYTRANGSFGLITESSSGDGSYADGD